MRKVFLGILTLLLLVSCGKRQDSEEGLAIFKYNESAGILTLDPIYAKDLPHIWACNQLFNSLVAFDDKMNLVPMVAKSWDISEDGLTYTFHLRDDVQFHEDTCFYQSALRPFDKLRAQGPRTVTAEDFVYSFNRVVDKSLNSPGLWIFSTVKHDDDHYAFTALDDTTFQIELSKPFPPFLGVLSMTYASVVPHEAVEYYGDDFRSHPVGTGPFKFQYWKENVKLVFRKNPNYFERDEAGERLPYIDAVSISFLIDKQVAFLEFIKGKFDFMSGIDARYKDELLTYDGNLRKKYEDKIELITEPYLNTEYFSFYIDPNDELGPERAKAMRQAVNLCIDREKMLRYLRNGIGEPGTGGMIPVGLPGHKSTIGYGYDLKRAQRLVADNHLEGYLLQLSTVADYADIGKFVQSQVEQIGLQCKMEVMPPATMRSMGVRRMRNATASVGVRCWREESILQKYKNILYLCIFDCYGRTQRHGNAGRGFGLPSSGGAGLRHYGDQLAPGEVRGGYHCLQGGVDCVCRGEDAAPHRLRQSGGVCGPQEAEGVHPPGRCLCDEAPARGGGAV